MFKSNIKILFCLIVLISILPLSACSNKKGSSFKDKMYLSELEKENIKLKEKLNNEVDNINDVVNDANKTSKENAKEGYENLEDRTLREYNEAMETLTVPGEPNDKTISELVLIAFYDVYYGFRVWAPAICIISAFIGMLIFFFARGNKSLKRFGLFGLIIGLPFSVLFVVYGVGILNDIFLF